eukprot:SAG31_NODE_890_length_11199_cov_18.490901_9_plen_48_part_00
MYRSRPAANNDVATHPVKPLPSVRHDRWQQHHINGENTKENHMITPE